MTEILSERKGPLGLITLNRPQALNALNEAMIAGLSSQLAAWEADAGVQAVFIRGAGDRAFCAGGDIKDAYHTGLKSARGEAPPEANVAFFREEYRMNRQMYHYRKPLIAFMDGITMGGGFGVAGPCRYRIATPRTAFAMPEVGIGLFPDVGSMYYLTRCPGRTGAYLAVTGQTVNAADTVYCGLATHYMEHVTVDTLIEDLASGPVEAILDNHSTAPTVPGPVALHRPVIDDCFDQESVEGILEALCGHASGWAAEVAALIGRRSPVSLKVTLEHYRRARGREFDAVIETDYRLVQHFMKGHDFYEGVRAMVIDKDRQPRWNPGTLSAVGFQDVEGFFSDTSMKL